MFILTTIDIVYICILGVTNFLMGIILTNILYEDEKEFFENKKWMVWLMTLFGLITIFIFLIYITYVVFKDFDWHDMYIKNLFNNKKDKL
jgi:cell shape-determining protein MreD